MLLYLSCDEMGFSGEDFLFYLDYYVFMCSFECDYLCFDVLFVLLGTYISWLLCAYCCIRRFVYYKYSHVLTSSVL